MKKSDESPPKTELTALELPDWSGMKDTSASGNADGAFKLCEEYVATYTVAVANYRKQSRIKCEVEFIL